MKIILNVDRKCALSLAQELEKTKGINNVSMRYSTKSYLKKSE